MNSPANTVNTVSMPRPSKSFRELYEDRLMEDFPQADIEEIEDMASNGEVVSAYFGSSGYEVYPDNIESHMHSSIFTRGYCALFAVVYAQKFGHTDFLLISKKEPDFDSWSGHILIAVNDSTFVDGNGAHELQDVESDYSPDFYSYEMVRELNLWSRGILNRDNYSHPLEFVEEFEQELTHRFVEAIHARVK